MKTRRAKKAPQTTVTKKRISLRGRNTGSRAKGESQGKDGFRCLQIMAFCDRITQGASCVASLRQLMGSDRDAAQETSSVRVVGLRGENLPRAHHGRSTTPTGGARSTVVCVWLCRSGSTIRTLRGERCAFTAPRCHNLGSSTGCVGWRESKVQIGDMYVALLSASEAGFENSFSFMQHI